MVVKDADEGTRRSLRRRADNLVPDDPSLPPELVGLIVDELAPYDVMQVMLSSPMDAPEIYRIMHVPNRKAFMDEQDRMEFPDGLEWVMVELMDHSVSLIDVRDDQWMSEARFDKFIEIAQRKLSCL